MDGSKTPPNWKRPSDVMRIHKLRLKKRALDFRLADKEAETAKTEKNNVKNTTSKNPFKRFESQAEKKPKFDANVVVDDSTTDGTLFRLLNFSQTQEASASNPQNLSFTNALSLLNSPQASQKDSSCKDKPKQDELFVDWTLRVKVRLMSTQPFPWNQKLKTCEEASGITGFVRCIDTDTDNEKISLDSSPNARFHQCCLVWQYPSLPWLELYPRVGKKSSASSTVSVLAVKDCLYQNWLESFRSLFQLVRAKQCPYFYLITNAFVCLFRAAGVNGYSEINASVTPTSRGFRQLLKDEDIEFSMPLKSGERTSKSPVTSDNTDTGYESVDVNEDELNEVEVPDNDDEETDVWLQNMGIDENDIKQLNASQADLNIRRERRIDDLPESLVFVEGVEAQGLFNFLVNCKSIISNNGPFAGVPPTLLSPVAFTGASLISLKVRESIIRQNENSYHSMEIRGPILPHMVHNLCDVMKNASLDKFSLTFADIECTKAFTSVTSAHIENQSPPSPMKTPRTPSIFGEQNLSDCGLKPKILARFCKNDVLQYDSIKFSESSYTCS